jgi:hypothetical protein
VLEPLLGIFQGRLLFDEVEMGEETEDFGETVRLKDIEEFKGFLHLSEILSFERTISNPKLPSIINSTKSTTLPRSIMLLRSFPHSTKVIRRVLPETTVIGPRG